MADTVVIGNRIPYRFFSTLGVGESDICTHAGSFHLALADAGIERYNVMKYSSIMPAIAEEVEKPIGYAHGSVLETIMAQVDVKHGERATAGIMYGWLHDRVTGDKFGGLVVEYMGHQKKKKAKQVLEQMLEELYTARQSDFVSRFELRPGKTSIASIVPMKKYGTALVALGFVEYIVPVIVEKKC